MASSSFVRRIDQLDATVLDDELLNLLEAQYRKALKYIPNTLLIKLGPEIEVLFKFLFKCLPLHVLKSTFGQNLFQLQYQGNNLNQPVSNNKLRILALITTCIPWLWERVVRRMLLSLPDNELAGNALDLSFLEERRFYILYQVLSLINFCLFLQRSSYPSVPERVLRIRPTYTEVQNIRSVHNDHIERELLWHGMAEFIGFTLPLVNVHKIKGFIKRSCMPKYYKNPYKKYIVQDDRCSICGDVPNFPHTMGCSHVSCYYCLASVVMADPSYMCAECDVTAGGMESLRPLALNE